VSCTHTQTYAAPHVIAASLHADAGPPAAAASCTSEASTQRTPSSRSPTMGCRCMCPQTRS
jgi:hypothetical protein